MQVYSQIKKYLNLKLSKKSSIKDDIQLPRFSPQEIRIVNLCQRNSCEAPSVGDDKEVYLRKIADCIETLERKASGR